MPQRHFADLQPLGRDDIAKGLGPARPSCHSARDLWGDRMTEPGLQRLAFNLLLALTLYVALTGGG
ncbi:MAG: hypothetical protein WBC68_02475 [Albidovulum sp.]